MRRVLFHVIPVIVLATSITAPVFAAADTGLEGTYVARGLHGDGSKASVLIQITAYGDCFLVVTMAGDPSREELPAIASIGIGIFHGGVLAVSDYGPDMARVVAYRVEDGGRRLVARWTFVDGDGTAYEQTLTKVPGYVDLPKDVSRTIP
jgi:hypothetical protein